MPNLRRIICLPALLVAGLLPAQGVAQSVDVEKARAEGTVILYTGNRTEIAERQAQLFEEKYGIQVEVLRASTADVVQRVDSELQAGQNAADVVHCLCQGYAEDLAKRGVAAPFKTSYFEKVPNALKDPEGRWMANRLTLLLLAYNKDKVGNPPVSWQDILKPEFLDKTSAYEPTYSALITVDALTARFGWEFMERFGKTHPIFYKTYVQALQWISTGERWIGIVSDYDAQAAVDRGEPVGITYPEEGVIPSVGVTWVMENAPHPNAARLFAEWLLSDEGQQSYIEAGQSGVRTDMDPGDGPNLSALTFLPVDFGRIAAETDAMITRYGDALASE